MKKLLFLMFCLMLGACCNHNSSIPATDSVDSIVVVEEVLDSVEVVDSVLVVDSI